MSYLRLVFHRAFQDSSKSLEKSWFWALETTVVIAVSITVVATLSTPATDFERSIVSAIYLVSALVAVLVLVFFIRLWLSPRRLLAEAQSRLKHFESDVPKIGVECMAMGSRAALKVTNNGAEGVVWATVTKLPLEELHNDFTGAWDHRSGPERYLASGEPTNLFVARIANQNARFTGRPLLNPDSHSEAEIQTWQANPGMNGHAISLFNADSGSGSLEPAVLWGVVEVPKPLVVRVMVFSKPSMPRPLIKYFEITTEDRRFLNIREVSLEEGLATVSNDINPPSV